MFGVAAVVPPINDAPSRQELGISKRQYARAQKLREIGSGSQRTSTFVLLT